ncbi:hypothetical protein ACEWY4_027119 [Coilia grayii]|uniref:Cadherin domain-containing protein n=1 Tax=Coilia grayii TaxID=363190 RepID=A0ABD1IRI4_9TELE
MNYVQSSWVFVLITVEDIPDLDPQFTNLPNSARVEEGTPVATSVFRVNARDPDMGVNSPIEYSIKSASVNGLFQISPDSGVISVLSELDREQHLDNDGVITLQIEAKETKMNVDGINAAATSEIQITIGDKNDEKPTFYDCTDSCVLQSVFNGNIDEHSAVGLPVLGLHITVEDKDKGENSTFDLSLDGPDKDAFSVVPNRAVSRANVQVHMKSPTDVDFEEKESMTVTIIAVDSKDNTFSSSATVNIAINDVNDNSPRFEKETYNLEVAEHSPEGTPILRITATDPDREDAGNIVYKLLPESMYKYFTVDPNTGEVKVGEDGALLDREGRSFYPATLQAKDKANNTGTAILEITLTDINDKRPRMARPTYKEFVEEGPGVKFEVEIQAFDDDEPDTPNSEIVYAIVPGPFSDNFTIDANTGLLKMNGFLDREAIDPELNGLIELNVTAFDKGEPPLGTWAIVEITVQDINDNKPHFQRKEYNFTVKEREQGAYINSVLAKDSDQTETNNRISFSIRGGGDSSFSVRSFLAPDDMGYWGNISVDQDIELDYETRKSYSFTVEAVDTDRNSDEARVNVTVLDVNDETPTLKAGIVIVVKENTTIEGGVIGKIVGKDEDTKHELEYELVSSECPCFKDGVCKEEWFLVEPTGDVKINPEYDIDYEACHEVILHVKVTDILTEVGKNSSEGEVTVKIEDINDNAPKFIPVQPNFVVLAESTTKGTSVAKVSATDYDSGENALMTFKVLAVKFIHNNNQTEDPGIIFIVEDQTQTSRNCSGTINSLQSLERNWKGQYVITVEVEDNGGLSSTSEVVVFTVDQSFRVSLLFTSTVEAFNANQETIKWALESATGTTVHIMSIEGNPAQRAQKKITVVAYFIYPNGTALSHGTVLNMVNGNPNTEFRDVLFANGLSGVHTVIDETAKEVDMELYISLAVVGTLMILVIVLTTLLVFMRRNYQRKLKASKAMNSATMAIEDNQKSGPVVPGTNKYTMEGANPVLNLNIDTATDLGFDEDNSNGDRSSINSLDDNIDMNMSDRDTMPMMVIEEEDEDEQHYYEPTSMEAVLAGRGRKKGGSNSPSLTFDNPALSTTDL